MNKFLKKRSDADTILEEREPVKMKVKAATKFREDYTKKWPFIKLLEMDKLFQNVCPATAISVLLMVAMMTFKNTYRQTKTHYL